MEPDPDAVPIVLKSPLRVLGRVLVCIVFIVGLGGMVAGVVDLAFNDAADTSTTINNMLGGAAAWAFFLALFVWLWRLSERKTICTPSGIRGVYLDGRRFGWTSDLVRRERIDSVEVREAPGRAYGGGSMYQVWVTLDGGRVALTAVGYAGREAAEETAARVEQWRRGPTTTDP